MVAETRLLLPHFSEKRKNHFTVLYALVYSEGPVACLPLRVTRECHGRWRARASPARPAPVGPRVPRPVRETLAGSWEAAGGWELGAGSATRTRDTPWDVRRATARELCTPGSLPIYHPSAVSPGAPQRSIFSALIATTAAQVQRLLHLTHRQLRCLCQVEIEQLPALQG